MVSKNMKLFIRWIFALSSGYLLLQHLNHRTINYRTSRGRGMLPSLLPPHPPGAASLSPQSHQQPCNHVFCYLLMSFYCLPHWTIHLKKGDSFNHGAVEITSTPMKRETQQEGTLEILCVNRELAPALMDPLIRGGFTTCRCTHLHYE